MLFLPLLLVIGLRRADALNASAQGTSGQGQQTGSWEEYTFLPGLMTGVCVCVLGDQTRVVEGNRQGLGRSIHFYQG